MTRQTPSEPVLLSGGNPQIAKGHGTALPDPAGLFNASLDGNTRRAIDIRETDILDEAALKALIQAAVARNEGKRKKA